MAISKVRKSDNWEFSEEELFSEINIGTRSLYESLEEIDSNLVQGLRHKLQVVSSIVEYDLKVNKKLTHASLRLLEEIMLLTLELTYRNYPQSQNGINSLINKIRKVQPEESQSKDSLSEE